MIILEVIKRGDNLGTDCKVLNIIGGPGKSGMGIVYICYDFSVNSIVAVKTFQDQFFSSLDAFNAFKLESIAWMNLGSHPHIVKALGVREIKGRPYLSMEYIAPDQLGRNNLTHYLKHPISLKKALKWGIQFCHAMEHSISHGVSPHRDIKPDNIMITNYQDLKITDFGLAKLWDQSNLLKAHLTPTGEETPAERINKLNLFRSVKNMDIAGTPPWMAPEQFEGIANINSDIYSFGLVLYQMINHGRLPFMARTIEGYKLAHQENSVPQIESKLFPIVKKCLAKSPEERYLNFKDLRFALEELYKKETGDYTQIKLDDEYTEFEKHRVKGSSFSSLGFYDEALKEYNKALTLNNNDPIVLNNLGYIYNKKELPDKALDVLNRALTVSPKNEGVCINIASAYILKARSLNEQSYGINAKKYIDKALELNPTNVDALHGLAFYYEEIEKDKNKAIEIYEKCLKIDPNNYRIYRSLGIRYRELGMIDKAFAMFKKSIKLNPQYEDGLHSLGISYGLQKMYDQALPIYQKLLKINPNNPTYRKTIEALQEHFSPKKVDSSQLFSSFKDIREKKKSKGKKSKK